MVTEQWRSAKEARQFHFRSPLSDCSFVLHTFRKDRRDLGLLADMGRSGGTKHLRD